MRDEIGSIRANRARINYAIRESEPRSGFGMQSLAGHGFQAVKRLINLPTRQLSGSVAPAGRRHTTILEALEGDRAEFPIGSIVRLYTKPMVTGCTVLHRIG
ncbi:PF06250 domain protein [Anopheles sinensis]|uniref:PF06250 domain protein n=1 Tax=Anopheles sinensis TaxID=74873 RepID=A0A084WF69_ANOSI|nr:PF06250 domain protein [Anopheles sinensis]